MKGAKRLVAGYFRLDTLDTPLWWVEPGDGLRAKVEFVAEADILIG